jgi:glycosyltransferase involved in cell wall biosynthesis
MKILLVTPAYHPSSFGGVKNYVTVLSRALARFGHDVTVYTSNAYDFNRNMDLIGKHKVEGVTVVYFKNYFPRKYWHTPGIIRQIIRDRGKFDVIHLNNNFSYKNFFVYLMATIYKIPIVFSAHGSLTVRFQSILLKKLYNRFVTSRILAYASRSIALNSQERQQYIDFGVDQSRIDVIPLGIFLEDFKSLDVSDYKKKLGVSEDNKLVLFIGRIHPIKGIEYAIKAIKRLVDEGYGVKLVLAGPCFGYSTYLVELVNKLDLNEHIIFVGPLYDREKLEALYGCDIFVLPSISDMFPTTVLEAGYCSLPLILSDGVLLSEKIKSKAAIVVRRDPSEIANAIKRLIDDKEYRLMLGEKAKRIVECDYDSETLAKNTLMVYKAVVEAEV